MDVFLVFHVCSEDDDQDFKLCGVFSTREAADSAVQRLVIRPGFRDFPSGFTVDKYHVDRDYWQGGFVYDVGLA